MSTYQDQREVVAAYLIQKEVASLYRSRTASIRHRRDVRVASAIAEHYIPLVASGRLKAATAASRVKSIVDAFKSGDLLKNIPGVKSIMDLPGAVKKLVDQGARYLSEIGKKLLDVDPVLKILLQAKAAIPSIGNWLNGLVDNLPESVRRGLSKISSKFKSIAAYLDDLFSRGDVLKTFGKVGSAAVYAYIWFNVTEVSWDIPEIVRGFTGQMTFVEILDTLPESALGLVISILLPGIPQKFIFNALLPLTVAMRMAYLYKMGVLKISGSKIMLEYGGQSHQY